jgi:hypothetical protein
MDKQEFKENLIKSEKVYKSKLESLKEKGYKKYVDWEIIRKLKVYLYNKGCTVDSTLVEYNRFYSCVILEDYIKTSEGKRGDSISVIVITPEDTEGTAYGKADRILIVEHKKYLEEKGESKNG